MTGNLLPCRHKKQRAISVKVAVHASRKEREFGTYRVIFANDLLVANENTVCSTVADHLTV